MTIVAYGYARSLADFLFGSGGSGGEIVITLMAEPEIVLQDDNVTITTGDDEPVVVLIEDDIEIEVTT